MTTDRRVLRFYDVSGVESARALSACFPSGIAGSWRSPGSWSRLLVQRVEELGLREVSR